MPDYDVFISYSRSDEMVVRRIYDVLESAGIEVWFDEYEIQSGENWEALIQHAINSANNLVVIISSHSASSTHVQDEIAYAESHGKLIIPVLVGDAQESDIPFMLRKRAYLDLRQPESFGQNIVHLVDSLRVRPIASESKPVAPAQPGAGSPEVPKLEETAEEGTLDLVSDDVEAEPAVPPPAPAPQLAEADVEEVVFGDVPEPLKKRKASRERAEPSPKKIGAAHYGAEAQTQPPHFTAYYPESVKPSAPYALMAFVHLESAREQVEKIAQGAIDHMGGSQRSAGVTSAINVDVGSLITFVPVVEGITFDVSERVVTWQPPVQSATFLFTTPETLPETLTGHVLVYQGPLIIGEIPVTMQVVVTDQPTSTTPNKSGEMQRLEPIFASYSHRDTPVMEYFRRSYERLGQKMLVDVYDLRAGEHWNPRLLEMIDESAVFQLFWSKNSAQSTYCRQEWEYALHYQDERPRFIRPVRWQDPMPPPPPELAGLHFQPVPISVLTRLQVFAAKLRDFLK